MKLALVMVVVLAGLTAISKEEPKKDEASASPPKVTIYGDPKALASIDQKTGEVTLEKGVEPEAVTKALYKAYIALAAQCEEKHKAIEKKEAVAKVKK